MAKNYYKKTQKSRFNASQQQHKRLRKKHEDCITNKKGNYDFHFVRLNYHSAVHCKQSREKRILSDAEKRKEYNRVISTFY